jgi:hypothetical protein
MTEICTAFTQRNSCCANLAHENGLCRIHSKKAYDECSICYDNMYVKETLYCGHSFCRNCIYKWKGSTCPMCRSIMFYVINQRNAKLNYATYHIKIIDDQIKVNILDEKFFKQFLIFLNENIWMYYYDSSYLDILFDYTSYILKNQIYGWKKQFKIMQSISMRLSR